jgi:3-(3-hydroxy-phenyl)propionate hydroxylase
MAKAHPLVTVRMSTTFLGVEQNAGGVLAEIENADGESETIAGSYLVSAEGARSCARKAAGVEFEGFTYPERTLNIEVAYDFTRHGFTERNYISDPVEYSNLFHWKGPPDRWRIHFPTDPNEDEEALTRPEAMQARLKRFLPIDGDFEICGHNLYPVHQRVATKFRVGRIILAGDAAHVNSPIGGMGLNSGVHDAFNLAEKLARVLKRETDEAELDRYDRQRRHIAIKHTQVQTMRNKRLLEERDPAVRKHNHEELRRVAENPISARKFLLRTSLLESLREAEQIA